MDNYLRIGFFTEQPLAFDPFHASDLDSWAAVGIVYENLLTISLNGELLPGLAVSWKRLTPNSMFFELRRDIKFHNGESFSAYAVKVSLEAQSSLSKVNPLGSSWAARYLSIISDIVVCDEFSLEIHTQHPDPLLLWKLARFSFIVPPKLLEEMGVEHFLEHHVGTGPFIFESMKKGKELRYSVNKGYWGDLPAFSGLRLMIIPSQYLLEALLEDKLDFVYDIPDTQIPLLNANHNIQVGSRLAGSQWFLFSSRGLLQDKNIREALNLAIDNKCLTELLAGMTLFPQTTAATLEQFGFNPDVKPFPYDLMRAKELLNEAGYVNGFRLKGIVADQSLKLAQIVAVYLEDIQVTLEYEVVPLKILLEQLRNQKKMGGQRDQDFVMMPMGNLWMHSYFNLQEMFSKEGDYALFSDSWLERLLTYATKTLDNVDNKPKFQTLEQYIHDEALMLFTVEKSLNVAARSGVEFSIPNNGCLDPLVFRFLQDRRKEEIHPEWDFCDCDDQLGNDSEEFQKLLDAAQHSSLFLFNSHHLKSNSKLDKLILNLKRLEEIKNAQERILNEQLISRVNEMREMEEILETSRFSGIASYYLNGEIALCNKTFLTLLNHKVGPRLSELFLTEAEWISFRDTVQQDGGFQGSLNFKRGIYDILEAQVTCSLTKDDLECLTGYILIIRDEGEERSLRTKLQQSYIKLKRSEDEHRTLVENISLGIFRTSGDFPGRFIQANSAMAQIFGYDNVHELMEISPSTLFVNPADRVQLVRNVIKHGECKNFELSYKKKNGSTFWGSVNIRGNIDLSGRLKWMDGVLQDTTQRKNAEQLRVEYHQRLEKDVADRTSELSQKLQELKEAQLELIQSEKLAALGQLVGGVAHEINTPAGAIYSAIHEVDKDYTLLLEQLMSLVTQLNPEHRQLYLQACRQVSTCSLVERSTTERRQLARGIRKKFEAVGIDQAMELSQDLALVGLDETTIEPILPLFQMEFARSVNASLRQFGMSCIHVRDIKIAITRIARLVKALKSYSHVDEDELVSTNIREGLDNTLIILRNELKRGVTVQTDYDDLPPVICYADELSQVWTNLIHNSIQAMKGDGIIQLRIKRLDDDNFFVEVEDNGPGIPPEVVPRIFEAYYTTKEKGVGTGMGLYVCQRIINRQGGRLEVTTTSPGKTVFRATLPMKVVEKKIVNEQDTIPAADPIQS